MEPNRIALVTRAGSGIGRAVSLAWLIKNTARMSIVLLEDPGFRRPNNSESRTLVPRSVPLKARVTSRRWRRLKRNTNDF
jgi:NAD(P)-dependent dehydrogenase (short-subunit alcohol dehydrogenase family)